jgi:DNA-binding CsgD family transcriptional regulator
MGDHDLIRDEANRRADTIDPVVGQLIRRLIEQHAQPRPADQADEIILDIEIHGVRYLAVRCAPRPRSAPDAERARAQDPVAAPSRGGHALSPRELEIARMVAKGYANKSIASVLDISCWTVSSHLRRTFSKLGVTSRAAMVAQLLDEERNPGAAPERRPQGDAGPVRVVDKGDQWRTGLGRRPGPADVLTQAASRAPGDGGDMHT